jgi:DNA-binding response OmpR family regulator
MKVLVIEDNARLSELMAGLLKQNGLSVDTSRNLTDAYGACAVASYDLVLLDLTLPDGNGIEFLRRLRARGDATPVLVASASGEVTERVRLLDEGADDYIVKPFALDELLARIRAILRRPVVTAPSVLRAGNISLDPLGQVCLIAGQPAEMPRLELLALSALLAQPGRLVPKARLEQAVYSLDDEVTPNAIEAVVSRLRKRLEAHGASMTISAMRGLGYSLTERPA